MKIKMLETAEDSNVFVGDEMEAAQKAAPHAIRITPTTRGGKLIYVDRVDRLEAGQEYEVPDSQGQNLVSKLKVAKKV